MARDASRESRDRQGANGGGATLAGSDGGDGSPRPAKSGGWVRALFAPTVRGNA